MIHLRHIIEIDSNDLFNYENKRDIVMAYQFNKFYRFKRFTSVKDRYVYYIPFYIPTEDELKEYGDIIMVPPYSEWWYKEIVKRISDAGGPKGEDMFIKMYWMDEINE